MLHLLKRYIPRGSAALGVTTLGSYILGLYRDRMFAHTFGAGSALDAYNAAFLVPDFLFNFFVASGIAAAFVPIFTDLLKEDREKAENYGNTILTAATLFMGFLAAILIIFAPLASQLVAPGFDETNRKTLIELLRILALSPILFAASNTLGAALVARSRFLFYGLSPMLYNVGIILGVFLLVPIFGITGVAYGTLAGALLHLAVRIIDVAKSGFRFRVNLHLRTPEFRKTLVLMLPKMFGHPVELATYWIFTAIASHLAAGSIVVLNFGRNFHGFAVSIVGIVIGTTTFPLLAQAATDRDPARFRTTLKKSFLLILGASAAVALMIFFGKTLLISTLLGGKAFDAAAVGSTAAVLGVFALSIPTESLSQLLARAYYATKNTTLPVVAAIFGLALAGIGAYYFSPVYGLRALPLAFVIGSLGKLAVLLAFLPSRRKFFSRQ